MEENNNHYEERQEKCFFCKHSWLKHFLVGLLTFIGAFVAFYVVADWHFKRMMDPVFQMRRLDKAIMKNERHLDSIARKEFQREAGLEKNASRFVHVEKRNDGYKIIIDLRPFDNNEKNVEVSTDENSLVINAAGEKNRHDKQEILRYSQTFRFGDDVDMSNITKVHQGNEYIITVPFKN